MSTLKRGAVVGLRIVVALIFGYAGWIKIQSPQAFADSIATFQILPTYLNNLLALGLPPFEIAVGILLLSGWKVRTFAFCGLVACGIFLLSLLSAILRGLPVECGCFGDVHSALSPIQRLWLDLGRDALLAGALLIVYLDARRRGKQIVATFFGCMHSCSGFLNPR